MSLVSAAPEFVSAAADLENIGSAISRANAAALPTSSVLAAGADEVSTRQRRSRR
jgi:PE family